MSGGGGGRRGGLCWGGLVGDMGWTDGGVWECAQAHAGGWREFRVSNGGGDGDMIGALGVEGGVRERW